MSNYLPVVKREVAANVAQKLAIQCDETYVEDQLLFLEKENPVIANWIRKYAATADSGELEAKYCAVITYNLLNSQAEVIYMESEINLG